MKPLLLLSLVFCLLAPSVSGQGGARVKDLVVVEGAMPVQLVGYGLVVGLDRTGDRARGQRSSPYTVQSIANMLRQFGIVVDPTVLGSRNAAAVMVTATMNPFQGAGSTLDVTVSSLGDAKSLSGGVLLQTPLKNPMSGQVHVMAQGPVATGAVLAASGGSSVKVNYTNTGRVPNGGLVAAGLPTQIGTENVGLVLKEPDFTNAVRLAEAVNAAYPSAATVEHAGLVRVNVPQGGGGAAGLIASLTDLRVAVDTPARIAINERTGTIVAGGNVRISEVMVTYGSLVISTQEDPFVSQPNPLAQGETVAGTVGSAEVSEDAARTVVLQENTNVSQLAAALNDLGLTPRDVIAIFQAIDQAGALQGELVIM